MYATMLNLSNFTENLITVFYQCSCASNLVCHEVIVTNNINFITGIELILLQDGSNMTGTDLCVNKPHCATAVRP